MSWIFGDIDFSTYGVMVSKSSGVLDLPNLKTEGYNWLDVHGLDYWQTEAPKFNDRDIVLNCWMMAKKDESYSGYENFKTKVAAFTDAVKAAGKVTFQTPYIDIENCSIGTGITITRETNYVQDIQAGTFVLRIKVHGDSDFNLVTIKDTTGGVVNEVVKTKNLTYSATLQGDEYVSFSCESNHVLNAHLYDYIQLALPNAESINYFLIGEPSYRKISTNKYQYNFRFYTWIEFLKQMDFVFGTSEEGEFEFWGNMEDIVDLIITNMQRWGLIYSAFVKGTIAATERRNFQFSGEKCFDVLKRIAGEYELEFELKKVIGATQFQINVVEFIGTTKAITLEYGKGNGLYELTRGDADYSKMCTVLHAFGAAKNLKPDYRNGLRRLSFDGNPLTKNDNIYGRWEVHKTFDEIYPNRTAAITGYLQILPDDPSFTEADREVFPEGIFVIGDDGLNDPVYGFDINSYLLGGLTAKVRIKTGDLAGQQFDIKIYDPQHCYIYIIPFKDERGYVVPNETLKPAAGDEYTLVDIGQPDSYVDKGEDDLEDAAQAYIDLWSTPVYPYDARITPSFIAANPTFTWSIGDKNTLVDTDFSINGLFRISQLTYNLNTGIIDVTYSDYRRLSKRQQLEFRVNEIERALLITKKDTVEVQRNDRRTTGEFSREILNPADDKLNADTIVREHSLDPVMLAWDAISLQWSITSLFEANVDGDEDKVKMYLGTFTISNYNALSRYEIRKRRENSIEYDPTRTWIIPETSYTLPTKDNYNIYVKLDTTSGSTDAEIEFSTEHIEGKFELHLNILRIKIGNTGEGEL